MRITAVIILMNITFQVFGQDFFEIKRKEDKIGARYPGTVSIYLSGPDVTRRKIEKGEPVIISGDYKLEIVVPWKSKPDLIEAKGGTLEILTLPQAYLKKETDSFSAEIKHYYKTEKGAGKKVLQLPQVRVVKSNTPKSQKIPGAYNLYIEYTNGLIFSYEDGLGKATQNGKEIEVTRKYFVQTPEGLLKLSFDPIKGICWWAFDSDKNYGD
ncbi:MAG: hypothetical protein WKF85_10185 [Chitinophagaceae bacterium]